MALEGSQIVRELSQYIHQHPDEALALLPLYDATRDHAMRGTCLHDNRCPLVTAGALLVNEQDRVFALRDGNRWAFAEGVPGEEDESLSHVALRVLEEFAGVRDVWTVPGSEGPSVIDVSMAAPELGPRLRVGFRYFFRAHSRAICPSVIEMGEVRWLLMPEIGTPPIQDRLLSQLAAAP